MGMAGAGGFAGRPVCLLPACLPTLAPCFPFFGGAGSKVNKDTISIYFVLESLRFRVEGLIEGV